MVMVYLLVMNNVMIIKLYLINNNVIYVNLFVIVDVKFVLMVFVKNVKKDIVYKILIVNQSVVIN